MRHSELSNEQILLALSESYSIVAAIAKIRSFSQRHWTSKG